jgi:ATP-binding protein involved in chromosome partitioning
MPTVSDIEAALRGVIDPELGSNIVDLGMVGEIRIEGTSATIGIALTVASCPMRDQIESDAIRRVTALPGLTDVSVDVTVMGQDQRSELMSRARLRARDNSEPTAVSPTTRVIAISSGKGGVGKSSVSVNVALAIADLGHRVGLLDADIWGFSVPRMLGANAQRLTADDTRKIQPTEISGIQLVSTGLILDDEDTALMWRGLMLSKALEQFLRDVAWDPGLDYLILDMPPGTGDVQMALSRLLPQAEMAVVTTPQRAAQMVAARVADMARRSHMPVLGVVENMAGFTTEDGRHYDLFGSGGGRELADRLGVPLIGQIPLDPFVVSGGDDGAPIVRMHPDAPAARAITAAARRLVELLPPAADDTCTARIDLLARQLDAALAASDPG